MGGPPVPLVEANDPVVANKIMWNNMFRLLLTDDYDLRFYDSESLYGGRNTHPMVTQYYQVGRYAETGSRLLDQKRSD